MAEHVRAVAARCRLTAGELKSGSYLAGVWIEEDTPYLVKPVDVTLHVGQKN
jgi:hypothetical protein